MSLNSAVWVAQLVPDGHVTVVANQFVIGEVPRDDNANFMYSKNLWTVAEDVSVLYGTTQYLVGMYHLSKLG